MRSCGPSGRLASKWWCAEYLSQRHAGRELRNNNNNEQLWLPTHNADGGWWVEQKPKVVIIPCVLTTCTKWKIFLHPATSTVSRTSRIVIVETMSCPAQLRCIIFILVFSNSCYFKIHSKQKKQWPPLNRCDTKSTTP